MSVENNLNVKSQVEPESDTERDAVRYIVQIGKETLNEIFVPQGYKGSPFGMVVNHYNGFINVDDVDSRKQVPYLEKPEDISNLKAVQLTKEFIESCVSILFDRKNMILEFQSCFE